MCVWCDPIDDYTNANECKIENGKYFHSFIAMQVVWYGAYMLHWALATITLFVMIFDVRSRILWPVQFGYRKRSYSTFFYARNGCCVVDITVPVLSFLCSLIYIYKVFYSIFISQSIVSVGRMCTQLICSSNHTST